MKKRIFSAKIAMLHIFYHDGGYLYPGTEKFLSFMDSNRRIVMKKKILSLILASVMVLSLTACGGSDKQAAPETTDAAA